MIEDPNDESILEFPWYESRRQFVREVGRRDGLQSAVARFAAFHERFLEHGDDVAHGGDRGGDEQPQPSQTDG